MSRTKPMPDELWRRLVNLTMDTRDGWRRAIQAATGLPHGRVRVLRRLENRPLTLSELADATSSDAPATTVCVNDLERRGLVSRAPHPTNRRAKLVALTPSGRALVAQARRVIERAPSSFADVAPADLAALARILDAVAGAGVSPTFTPPKRGK